LAATDYPLKYGLTVSQEILAAIGATVVRQSSIELGLADLIIRILSLDQQLGFTLTVGMSFRILCATFDALIQKKIDPQGDEYKEVRRLMGLINSFEQFRNQVAHSIWAHSQDFDAQVAVRLRAGKRTFSQEVSLQTIEREMDVAGRASAELSILVRKLIGDPVPHMGASST
jgi:hypothetical protein